jgi:hypothetical protein
MLTDKTLALACKPGLDNLPGDYAREFPSRHPIRGYRNALPFSGEDPV